MRFRIDRLLFFDARLVRAVTRLLPLLAAGLLSAPGARAQDELWQGTFVSHRVEVNSNGITVEDRTDPTTTIVIPKERTQSPPGSPVTGSVAASFTLTVPAKTPLAVKQDDVGTGRKFFTLQSPMTLGVEGSGTVDISQGGSVEKRASVSFPLEPGATRCPAYTEQLGIAEGATPFTVPPYACTQGTARLRSPDFSTLLEFKTSFSVSTTTFFNGNVSPSSVFVTVTTKYQFDPAPSCGSLAAGPGPLQGCPPDPPTVSALDAEIAARETTIRVTVTGTNFGPDAVPQFLKPADNSVDPNLVMSNVAVKSPTLIEADLTVKKEAELGTRFIRVASGGKDSAVPLDVLNVIGIVLEVDQGAKTPPDASRVANHPTVVRAFIQSAVPLDKTDARLYYFNGEGKPFSDSPLSPKESPADNASVTVDVRTDYTSEDRFFLKDSLNFYFPEGFGETAAQFVLALNPRNPKQNPPIVGLDRTPLLAQTEFIAAGPLPPQNFVETKPLRIVFLLDEGIKSQADRLEGANKEDQLKAKIRESVEGYLSAAFPVSRPQLETKFLWNNPKLVDLDALRADAGDGTLLERILLRSGRLLETANWIERGKNRPPWNRIVFLHRGNLFGMDFKANLGLTDGKTAAVASLSSIFIAHYLAHTTGLGDTGCGGKLTHYGCKDSPLNPRRADAVPNGNLVEDGAVRLLPLLLGNARNVGASASVNASGKVENAWALQRVDLMGSATRSNDFWPDRIEWDHLYNRLVEGLDSAVGDSEILDLFLDAASKDGQTTGSVSGVLTPKGGSPSPLAPGATPGAGPLQSPPEELLLELHDAAGAVVGQQAFGLDAEIPDGSGGTAGAAHIRIPSVATARQAVVTKAGQPVAALPLSANPPSVQITASPAGQTVTGPVTVSWAGSDPDGDPLAYSVFYQRGAEDRTLLAVGLAGTSFEFDPRPFGGGADVRVLVLASDGVRQALATSPAFTVGDASPTMAFAAPETGASFPSGVPVTFAAAGYDPEDGPLPAASLAFTSSIDGPLGTGETVRKTLSPGLHTVTLRGTDSAGQSAEATVHVSVGPVSEIPTIAALTPDSGPAGTAVTLTGSGFDPAGSVVRFGGQTSAITSASAAQIVAVAPAGLTAGEVFVDVTANGQTGPSASFLVTGSGTTLRGDVTGDRSVDVSDVVLVLRIVVGLTEGTAEERKAADVNADLQIDVLDAIKILRIIVGLE